MTDVAGWPMLASPHELADLLAAQQYIAGDDLAAAAFLALRMRRPLFLEGEPGVGKSDFAFRISRALGARYSRLQCYAGIDASQALYDWDFPRQILALRADDDTAGRDERLRDIYTEPFLRRRPILDALTGVPTVLLIDEIDRADDEFEALLLEVLEDYIVNIPEYQGPPISAGECPPLVVLTSNRTREVHDALKRRCLYHWIEHPTPGLEERILTERVAIEPRLARQIADGMRRVRATKEVTKPPGVAEAIDFATALHEAGATELTPATVRAAVSTLVKYREDTKDVVRLMLLPYPREEP
jgi:MoxR-like ATPase